MKNYFDAVMLLDMLHLVEMTHGVGGVRKVLEQASAKLKPGGKLLAYTSAPRTQERVKRMLTEMRFARINLSSMGLTEADREALKYVWVKR